MSVCLRLLSWVIFLCLPLCLFWFHFLCSPSCLRQWLPFLIPLPPSSLVSLWWMWTHGSFYKPTKTAPNYINLKEKKLTSGSAEAFSCPDSTGVSWKCCHFNCSTVIELAAILSPHHINLLWDLFPPGVLLWRDGALVGGFIGRNWLYYRPSYPALWLHRRRDHCQRHPAGQAVLLVRSTIVCMFKDIMNKIPFS